jgi:hypothetical protein
MANPYPSLPPNVPANLIDRETQFSPYDSRIDISIPASSQSSFQSQASIPSLTSTVRSQHHFTLKSGRGSSRPWLTLMLSSRSPRPRYLPMYIGKDDITGTVELDLPRPESIRQVTVSVCVVSLPLIIRTSQLPYNPVVQGRGYSSHPRTKCFS